MSNAIMGDNREIVKWLSHINSESCVNTTITNPTLEKQQQQQRQYNDQNGNLHNLRNAIAETSAENTTLAKEIAELMNKLHITPQTLANDVKENLLQVSAVLKYNGLSDVQETALIISMNGRRIKEKKQCCINRELKAKYKELSNRHCILENKLKYLQENVVAIKKLIEENELEYKNESSNYKLLMTKLVQYNSTATDIETEIDSLNLMKLEPDKILDKYKKYMERKGQLAEINQALVPYNNLPPNLFQAKALLENKEMEFHDITKKFLSMS